MTHVSRFAALALGAAVFLSGCRQTAPLADEPFSADEKVLQALDAFNPIYKVDANGRVTHLKLDGRHVLASALADVGKLTEIEELSLYAASLSDESLAHLHGLKKLARIGLGATPITDQGLAHLEKLPALRHIWLPKANVSDEGVAKLKAALPHLNVHFQ